MSLENQDKKWKKRWLIALVIIIIWSIFLFLLKGVQGLIGGFISSLFGTFFVFSFFGKDEVEKIPYSTFYSAEPVIAIGMVFFLIVTIIGLVIAFQ